MIMFILEREPSATESTIDIRYLIGADEKPFRSLSFSGVFVKGRNLSVCAKLQFATEINLRTFNKNSLSWSKSFQVIHYNRSVTCSFLRDEEGPSYSDP